MSDQMRGKTQREFRILDTALGAIAPERVGFVASERAARRQCGVPVHLAGHAGEQRPAAQRVGTQAFDAMRPVAFAAEHPQHHDLGLAQRALDIEIDRSRMPEREQIGQLHARKVAGQRRIGRSECGEVAVGRRQHDDVGGLLPEIARDVAIVDLPLLSSFRCIRVEVLATPASARRTASPSKPFSPITTRCSACFTSGRANARSTRPPTACTTIGAALSAMRA